MQAIFRDVSLIAPSESRVLITGESGVGKEVLADVIHAWSPRAAGPLVKVNCAAIPETLLESELFGHEKGAFTGAVAQRIGRFEKANGGTIFLDEIAEMSPQLQAKLLRVAQDGRFQRIGSNTRNPRQRAHSRRHQSQPGGGGQERAFSRGSCITGLNVVELNVPPLRERREDILPLAGQIARGIDQGPRAAFRRGGRISGTLFLAGQRARTAQRHGTRRAAFWRRIDPARASARAGARRRRATGAPACEPADARRLEEIERQAVLETLRKHDFNRTETAKALGISRRALIYKLQRLREQGCDVDPKPGNGI